MPDEPLERTSWRDRLSAAGQEHLDSLFDFALRFGVNQLEKRGVLAPFGAVVTTEGEQKVIGILPGNDIENAPNVSDALIQQYQRIYRQDRDSYSATMIGFDVRVPGLGGDAIAVQLESREGVAMTMLAPYKLKGFGRKRVRLGEFNANGDDPVIWPDDAQ